MNSISPGWDPPTRDDIIAVHGRTKNGTPAYSPWFRARAGDAFIEFVNLCQLTQAKLSEFLRLDYHTIAAMERATKLPSHGTVTRLILCNVIRHDTGEPNRELAAALKPLSLHLLGPGNDRWSHVGIAGALKEYRRTHGLSAHDLAAKIAISRSVLGSWEAGRSRPSPQRLVKLVLLGIVDRDTAIDLLDHHYPRTHKWRNVNRSLLIRAEQNQ